MYQWLGLSNKTLWSGLAIFAWLAVLPPAYAQEEASPQALLHILDYLAVDYPAVIVDGRVINADEYQEQKEFAEHVDALMERLPAAPEQQALIGKAQELRRAIDTQVAGERVALLCRRIMAELIRVYRVEVAPRQVPSLESMPALFQAHCAECHGANGAGDGPQAAQLEPRPANFHDVARQSQRSVYALFNTITLGVQGTAMRPFGALSEAQRWALAFYVSGFMNSAGQRVLGNKLWEQGVHRNKFPDINAVTNATPAVVLAEHGVEGTALLAYLRAHPEQILKSTVAPLELGRQLLHTSANAYRSGNKPQAYEAAVAAYLQGYELVEMQLRSLDAPLSRAIEQKMAAYREAISNARMPADELQKRAEELDALLEQAARQLNSGTLTPLMGAFSAFVLLLREGMEAILVVAAIIAFLIKSERRAALPYVHMGWIAALVLGGLTWVISSRLFAVSGADRETTEGLTALLAAAILVYMGYWLHNNANAQRWKGFIQSKLQGALGGRALWTLVVLSFIAVYREVFETILFFETLWLQVPEQQHYYLLGGVAAGAMSLAALAWVMFRFSVRLPLKLFFNVNAVLMYGLAIIFAGKGIAALQEAGKIHMHSVSFPRVEMLGIFPNMEALGAQAALLLLAVTWLVINRFKLGKLPKQ